MAPSRAALFLAIVTFWACRVDTGGLEERRVRRDAGGTTDSSMGVTDAQTELDAGPGGPDAGPPREDSGPPPADAGSECIPIDESCDGTDEDCNGTVDDGSAMCGADTGCEVHHFRGNAYLFCSDTEAWIDASATCMELGYHLVTIDDGDEQDFIDGITSGIASDSEWWIGAYTDAEGDLRWAAGSSSYTRWQSAPAEANQCVFHETDEDGWEGKSCGGSRRYVCEADLVPLEP